MMPPRDSRSSAAKDRLSRTDIGSISPSVLRSSGISAMPMRVGFRAPRGLAMRHRLAVDQHLAATRRCSTPNSASSSSRWPWPSRPPRPTTSPARDRAARCRCSRSVQDRLRTSSTGGLSVGGRRRLRREDVAVFAADHHLDDLVVGLGAGLVGRDVAAVAEHRAFVGESRRSRACGARCRAAPGPRRAAASAPRRPCARRPRSAPRSPRRG